MLIRDIFLDILSEARRNPDINKKESALSVLKKYQGRDVFVSYTHDVGAYTHGAKEEKTYFDQEEKVNKFGNDSKVHNVTGAKLGINPNVEYSTPVGIYTYPIDYVLEHNGRVPFGGERPYIWVVEPTGAILNLVDYSDEGLNADIEDLKKLYSNIIDDSFVRVARSTAKVKTPGGYIWNITRLLAQQLAGKRKTDKIGDMDFRAAKIWTKIFRQLGYAGAADMDGEGIIHENEETQAVFFGMDGIKVLELIRNIKPREPMSQMAIWLKQPAAFKAAVKKGTLNDDQIIDIINKHSNLIEYLPEISKKVQDFIISQMYERKTFASYCSSSTQYTFPVS